MKDILNYEAYFFDFDGLLANTEKHHFKAYEILLKRRGFSLSWDFSTYVSFAHQKTDFFAREIYNLFPSLEMKEPDWMKLREEKQAIYLDLLYHTKIDLMPGVFSFLDLLNKKEKKLYVVTNAPKNQIDAVMAHQPLLRIIPTWVTRECYTHAKPSPDGYLKGCELHSKHSFKGVGFEDSIKGLQALENSPLDAILIYPSYYPQDKIQPRATTRRFSSFEELMHYYHL